MTQQQLQTRTNEIRRRMQVLLLSGKHVFAEDIKALSAELKLTNEALKAKE